MKKGELVATADCAKCIFKKGMMNKAKGKKLPGLGKCTHPEGFAPSHCSGRGRCPKEAAPETPEPRHEALLSDTYPNPCQPRKLFDQGKLDELAASILEHGLMEPLVVVERPQGDRLFMIVAGERRWRACALAGLDRAPIRVIEATDDQVAELALIENIQRQDLTPMEEARAFQALLDKGLTIEDLCKKLGFKQPWQVYCRTNLLSLAPKFQEALALEIISDRDAYQMSRLDYAGQETVYHKVKTGALPTHQKVRFFVNTMVEAKSQATLFELPKKEDLEIISRWEKNLEAVTGLICKSFSQNDCRVLAKVLQGNASVNIMKVDLIIRHLNLIKKAMLENASKQEVGEELKLNFGGGA